MRTQIALSESDDPHAILSIDFARDTASLLVGRYSEDDTPHLGRLAIAMPQWLESYDFALSGIAARARYCDAYNRIVFCDEGNRAFVVQRDQEVVPLGTGVDAIFAGRDDTVVALSGDTSAVLDVETTERIWNADDPAVIAISRTASLLASGSPSSGDAHLIDFRSSRVLRRFTSQLKGISGIRLDDRGQWVGAIGAHMNGCAVWNGETGERAGQIFCHETQDNNMAQAFHPTRDLIAYATIAGYVVLVDLAHNKTAYMEQLHQSRIHDLCFSADGNLLATAGDDGAITVIELDEMLSLGMTPMDRWS